MDTTAAHIALIDQFIANTRQRLTETINAMREVIQTQTDTPEITLTQMALTISQLCQDNVDYRDNMISLYVLALYDLAKAGDN